MSGYVLVKETVIEFPSGKKDLGYTHISGMGIFLTQEDGFETIQRLNLPLGWVIMPLDQLFPGHFPKGFWNE